MANVYLVYTFERFGHRTFIKLFRTLEKAQELVNKLRAWVAEAPHYNYINPTPETKQLKELDWIRWREACPVAFNDHFLRVYDFNIEELEIVE